VVDEIDQHGLVQPQERLNLRCAGGFPAAQLRIGRKRGCETGIRVAKYSVS
jgi:hypothetical protein